MSTAEPLVEYSNAYLAVPWGGAGLVRELTSEDEERGDGQVPWQRVHENLCRLGGRRTELDAEEAGWLVKGIRCRVHRRFGFASMAEYLEQIVGYTPRMARERMRVAQALAELPGLHQDLRSGTLKWSAVRELTRVATSDTEDAWREAVHGSTLRDIERAVSGRERGSLPTDAVLIKDLRRRLNFDVSTQTFALVQEMMAHVRREAGARLSDEDVLGLVARRVLGGAHPDPGEPSTQVHLQVCPDCGAATQRAGADDVAVPSAVVEQASCDSRFVQAGARARTSIPPATRRQVMARDAGRCQAPGCRHHLYVDVHHVVPQSMGGTHSPQNLVVLCTAHHRAVHQGFLHVRGTAGELHFQHADGTDYRRAQPDVDTLQIVSNAVLTLQHSGFSKEAAVAAVAEAVTHVGRHGNTLDQRAVVDRALERLAEEPPS